MIVLGIILLVVGFITGLGILQTIGGILLVIGIVLLVAGQMGHAIGGRKHFF